MADGYRNKCRTCRNKNFLKWRKSNPKQIKIHNEIKRQYYQNHRDAILKQKQEYFQNIKNLDSFKNYKTYMSAKRRAEILRATLPGFEKEIKGIYNNRPNGYHVDHIIPLRGKTVRGLHVPWNLQYLKEEDNLRKSNKVEK